MFCRSFKPYKYTHTNAGDFVGIFNVNLPKINTLQNYRPRYLGCRVIVALYCGGGPVLIGCSVRSGKFGKWESIFGTFY